MKKESVWKYSSKGEFPKNEETVILIVDSIYRLGFYSELHNYWRLNEQWHSNDRIEKWCYIPEDY